MNAVTRQSLDLKGNWVECSGADAPAGDAASSAACSVSDERLAQIIGEYTGYQDTMKLGAVYGTPTMGEFLSLLGEVRAARAVKVMQGDGFVVCSSWRDKSNPVPPYKGTYSYEHFDTLNEAYACHRDYENGEFANASAMGVFAALGGMPVGGRIV